MNYRDFLQKVIYDVINPLIKLMIKVGVTPNIVTFTGFLGNCLAAFFFINAAFRETDAMAWIGWGGLILNLSGLFDMMDGRLARLGNMSSAFGAFWDSTLDRYSELISLGGLAAFWFTVGNSLWGVVTLLALIGSIMVSYVRARAEALGLECKVGLMQRPERVVVLSVGAMVTGLINNGIAVNIAVALIAVLANITAFWRVWYCYKQLKEK
jgi:CDP-diacylglycerol--glycerol-3-phosphate 3-phosphatidyltransferase